MRSTDMPGLGAGGPNTPTDDETYSGPDENNIWKGPLLGADPTGGLGSGGPNIGDGGYPDQGGNGRYVGPDQNNIWKGPLLGADPTGGNGGYVGPDSGNIGQYAVDQNPPLGLGSGGPNLGFTETYPSDPPMPALDLSPQQPAQMAPQPVQQPDAGGWSNDAIPMLDDVQTQRNRRALLAALGART